MPYNPELFYINNIFDMLLETFIMSAHNKEIELTFKCNEKLTFFADKNMLITALRNLISNAIKFTPRNGKIEVSAEKHSHILTIIVKDSGVGMTLEQIDKVFKIESSFTTLGTEKEEGTGLGLILVKELVGNNRGRLLVNSKIGNGTVFTLTFDSI